MCTRNFLLALMVCACVHAETGIAALPEQAAFKTPEDAARELVDVLSKNDLGRLTQLLGTDSEDLVSSGDPVTDRSSRKIFVALASESSRAEIDPAGNAFLYFGQREWPFPIPLTKSERGWVFNTIEGKEEIIDRRIGKNELETIDTLRAFVDAQADYLALKPTGVAEYAQRIASSPNKRDGLFWPRKKGEAVSPLGPLVAEAQEAGYTTRDEVARAYHGYRFKLLTTQSANAATGEMNYLDANKRMTKGFAFVAYPAEWGVSGVMTFITNQDGVILEKNLGAETPSIVQSMTTFDPSKDWKKVDSSNAATELAQSEDSENRS